MTADVGHIRYGQNVITFTVVRRARTTLEIGVEPDASVTVVAPVDASAEAIAAKVRKRAAWVRRQQRFFSHYLPHLPERRFVSGETHYYLGRPYRLKVRADTRASVRLIRGFILVQSREPDRAEVTRGLVQGWYRDRARTIFAQRLEVNLARFPDPEAVRPRGLIVRHMRRRWGSISPTARLLLNRRLIEAPVDAVDYVITHELCHIAEPHHGPAFFALLDRTMPDWPTRKERLERNVPNFQSA